MRGLKWGIGITTGMFAAGIAVGYVANQRGIPQDQVPRWLVKGVTKRLLRGYDALRDLLPDGDAVPLADALEQDP